MFHNCGSKFNLLDPNDAAEFLGVKEQTLAVWRSARRYGLPYIRVGRLIRYRESDLIEFLAGREVRPGGNGEGAAEAGR